ncbi:MAG: glycosyltransferase family 2 protein [Acidaminococcaceae bacterium]|nr:glycosyltransferase family 2 protein [Acidaminococcaceae bacterium]
MIVPVYNAEKFIDKCVKSLLGQAYQNIEIILVDDESPDTCPQLCDKYAGEDNRVRVIHQKNRGASGARENGLKIASGEYVSFVDPDDWLELSAIGEMTAAAENYGADIVICDWKTFT